MHKHDIHHPIHVQAHRQQASGTAQNAATIVPGALTAKEKENTDDQRYPADQDNTVQQKGKAETHTVKVRDNIRTTHTVSAEADRNIQKDQDEAEAQNPGGAKARAKVKGRHTPRSPQPRHLQKIQHRKRKWLDQNPNRNDSHRQVMRCMISWYKKTANYDEDHNTYHTAHNTSANVDAMDHVVYPM